MNHYDAINDDIGENIKQQRDADQELKNDQEARMVAWTNTIRRNIRLHKVIY